MKIEDLKKVPDKPGVYIWKDKNESIVYIGKAKKLKTRLTQYIRGSVNSYKTQKMMQEVASFDYILSTSEKEALILERNLINKYKPIFNIKLTDDKRYPYIKVQVFKEDLKVTLSYKAKQYGKNISYFGPFPSGYGAKKMSDFLNREFVYKNGLPYKTNDSNYWQDQYEKLKKLMTRSKSLIKTLKEKMELSAENQKYEIAQDIKETINAIVSSAEEQVAEIKETDSIDVVAFYEKSGYLSIEQMFYRQGMMLSNKKKIIEITHSADESIRQFMNQYYEINLQPTIILSNKKINLPLNIHVPEKGKKKQILKIALRNAEDNIEFKLKKFIRKEEMTIGALNKLKKILNLKKLNHIMMIDNSNYANTNPISAIVSYRNGIQQKAEYKKYKLEEAKRKSDVEYMHQGIKRYFENKDNPIPDLFIVDGGIQQVNEVKNIVTTNLIGLVKNDKHRTEAIINKEGKRIEIEDPDLYNFLSKIQIEVDRFAKSFYRFRARRTTLEGKLKSLPGIGEKTEQKLLEVFHSYSAIYNATEKKLTEVVGEKIAKIIIKELRK